MLSNEASSPFLISNHYLCRGMIKGQFLAPNPPFPLPCEIRKGLSIAQLERHVPPGMAIWQCSELRGWLVNHRPAPLTEQPLLGDHDAERRILGVIIFVHQTVRKTGQGSLGKAHASIFSLYQIGPAKQFLASNYSLQPPECRFLSVVPREMNEIWRNVWPTHAYRIKMLSLYAKSELPPWPRRRWVGIPLQSLTAKPNLRPQGLGGCVQAQKRDCRLGEDINDVGD